MRRIEDLRLGFIELVGDVGLVAFGSDWVGVCRCYLILVLFYSVKDFQNIVVSQWLSKKLCFGEVTFTVQRLYCKASVNHNGA